MGSRIQFCLLVISIQIFVAAAALDGHDFAALSALKNGAWQNTPHNWVGADPCDNWDGIRCTNSRVTSIILPSMGLTGQLSSDILQLSELQILDLSYNKGLTGPLPPSIGDLKKLTSLTLIGCSFTDFIPDTIGSLQQLYTLDLNSNKFRGPIPPSIGNLLKLTWLDLANNSLSGSIPVSNGTTPGLNLLVKAQHFHFSKNNLSGVIPSQLFSSNMALIHVLLDSNQLVGNIPPTLGLVNKLEVLRLDNNSLNGSVPSNLNNLIHVRELYLSNNQLTGPLPNLTGMNSLYYVDMSNNSFNPSDFPPWVLTMQSLTTLVMENTQLQGQIPVPLFSFPELQTLLLRNNKLNGTLDVGFTPSNRLTLVNLQNNSIDSFKDTGKSIKFDLILTENPFCTSGGEAIPYCDTQQSNSSSSYPYSTQLSNCYPATCSSDKKSSPKCSCAHPYTGTLNFRTVSFSNLANISVYAMLETSLMRFFQSHQLPVDSVSLSNPHKNTDDYLLISLEIFPSGQDSFNQTGFTAIANSFSNQTYDPPDKIFGPYFLSGDSYFAVIISKSSNNGIIIGAAVGGSVFALLSLLAGLYAFRQKKRAERADKMNHPFASWDPNKSNGDVPDLKGARCFSFEELRKYSNNFSEANSIGSGGYGKVYRGILPTGKLVAIKRAQHGSMQGGIEFKSEIELLSRIHHKNVVSLVGFCFEQAEQMLVYEYIPNGSLNEGLSGKSGIRMDWIRRLRIALGAARGLHYLHELADPPIIHRDIKSNNILLDERLNAKVADFGLSKPLGDIEKGHITTQVKGTMGYMDPEYYMTQQLTEKSDVYSFGVVMLELITARQPIEKGKYIVREVKQNMDKTKVLYNLNEVLDPALSGTMLKGLEKFVDVAMRCVEEAGDDRPTMGEVVKEIENIMQIAGLNPNAESTSTSASYEGASKGYNHPYSDEGLFVYSGSFLPSKLEPH